MDTSHPPDRNLPVILPREVERTGYQLLAALDRLGFVHKNGDGSIFTICFNDAALFGSVACYSVDMERLWHFRAGDLACARTLEHLALVLKKPIMADTRSGLRLCVRLRPAPPPPSLPAQAALDLDSRPAGALQVPVGVGLAGPLWRGLPALGHVLICGATGSGKSAWGHAALAALLTANSPAALRVVLIDPKRSELAPWRATPHLARPIATTPEDAAAALADLVAEIDRRGDLLASAGARDLAGYNRRAAGPLPYLLCYADECLDMVLAAGARSELTAALQTITIRGRSAGVLLWAATQHAAAVAGLPRVVNVNLASRLVFRVVDGNAARAAGCPGAQNIPRDRPGRMLARLEGEPVEVQAYWLSDEALAEIAEGVTCLRSKPVTVLAKQAGDSAEDGG